MLAPKKKLASVLCTALLITLFGIVVFLLLSVRHLYHEHQKFQRMKKYTQEVNLFEFTISSFELLITETFVFQVELVKNSMQVLENSVNYVARDFQNLQKSIDTHIFTPRRTARSLKLDKV